MDSEVMTNFKFKIGDRVKYVPRDDVGIGIVIGINSENIDYPYRVYFAHHVGIYYPEDQLELCGLPKQMDNLLEDDDPFYDSSECIKCKY